MNKTIERQIRQIYDKVFNKVYSHQNLRQLSSGNRSAILQTIAKIESSSAYDLFAREFAIELSKKGLRYQRGIWRKFYAAAKRLHVVGLPISYSAYESQLMKKAVEHNFTMIKSIPQKTMIVLQHKYTSSLIEEVAKGVLGRGSFERQLRAHGAKNAKLIARTETAKLQTSIAENRARDVGSVAYIWLSSRDRRTRPSHQKMNGVVVFWRDQQTEKPHLDNMYGNAGEFPNCRCAPQPIVDPDQLKSSSYDVYDYRTDKIIKIKTKDLITKLSEGRL